MRKQLWHKIKEALVSVLPVTFIVIALNFTPLINLELYEIIVFSVSALFLILGIGLFNLGADMAMQPMGEQIGTSLIKTKKLNPATKKTMRGFKLYFIYFLVVKNQKSGVYRLIGGFFI